MKLVLTFALLFLGLHAATVSAQDIPKGQNPINLEYWANVTCWHFARASSVQAALLEGNRGADLIQLHTINFTSSQIAAVVSDFDVGGTYYSSGFAQTEDTDDSWEATSSSSSRRKQSAQQTLDSNFLEMANPPSNDAITLAAYQRGGDLIPDGSERVDDLMNRNVTADDVKRMIAYFILFSNTYAQINCNGNSSCDSGKVPVKVNMRYYFVPYWGTNKTSWSIKSNSSNSDDLQIRTNIINSMSTILTYTANHPDLSEPCSEYVDI